MFDNLPLAEDFVTYAPYTQIRDDSQYRPIWGWLQIAIERVAGHGGANPHPYHLLSLAIHLSATGVVALLAWKLADSLWAGIGVGLLFAFYVRNHEAIFWSAAASHALMTLLVASALLAYVWAHGQQKSRFYWLALFLFTTALFTVEAAVAGTALFVFYEILWRKDMRNGEGAAMPGSDHPGWLRLQLLPFMLVPVLYLATLVVTHADAGNLIGSSQDRSGYHLCLDPAALKEMAGYVTYAVLPFVPLRSIDSQLVKAVLALLAVVCLVCTLTVAGRLARFGALWLLVAVTPYALLVPFGNADRYFYFAAPGFALAVVGCCLQLRNKIAARWPGVHSDGKFISAAIVPGAALVLALSIASIRTLLVREAQWQVCGEKVAMTLASLYAQFPCSEEMPTVYLVGVPGTCGPARFLGVGARSALRTHCNNPDASLLMATYPPLMDAVRNTPAAKGQPADARLFLYKEDGVLEEHAAALADSQIKQLLEDHARYP